MSGTFPRILEDSPVRVVFKPGSLDSLGELAKAEGASRVLLVSDPGIVAAGYADRAAQSLRNAGISVSLFADVGENPTTAHIAAGVEVAQRHNTDFCVAIGGGSAIDCAKGINLLLTNGGAVRDYWGVNKATKPLLPSIAIPTTAGTGSEAQSFALISDADTHAKMASGDRRDPRAGGLRPRVAILDSDLTRTQPRSVAIASGLDAISHAVETAATNTRNDISRRFTREAWRLLAAAFETAITDPSNDAARADMLLGAHLAGAAIEYSMLGAAHSCANPLTATYGTTHGIAVAVMLPHVIRFNAATGENPYADLEADVEIFANRITAWLTLTETPPTLREHGVEFSDLPALAESAAAQWTAQFNPRPVGRDELLAIYEAAFD